MMGVVRVIATIFAGPFLLLGLIWTLQGFKVPGTPVSFMTGDIKWAIYGVVLAAVGVVLVWWVNRRSA
jgi:hypothetical protein